MKNKKKKVIIDCDPGIDDSLALLSALKSNELDVIAITLVEGNVDPKLSLINACKVLNLCKRYDIPIYLGEENPLVVEYVNAKDTHGEDGMGENNIVVNIIDFKEQIKKESAVEFYIDTFKSENKDVSIIALGTLTNFAKVIEKDSKFLTKIGEFVTMGGAFRTHGNCSPVSEYNYWCDPHAAKIVYDSAFENNVVLTMIPLDVTRPIVLTKDIIEMIKNLNQEVGDFCEKITKFYIDFHIKQENINGCVINDPVVIIYFLKKKLLSGFKCYTQIETESAVARGQTLCDYLNFYRKHPNSMVMRSINVNMFFINFIALITDKDVNSVKKYAIENKINFKYKYPYKI